MSQPVLRFAPSPTGRLHVGNLRVALMNWLYARKAGGEFILRIDDTDKERSREEHVEAVRRDLEWLGLDWDRYERQSLRLDRYAEAAEKLRAEGKLYEAFETPAELDLKRKSLLARSLPPVYDRAALKLTEEAKAALRAEGRAPHERFLLNRQRTGWADLSRGAVEIDTGSLSDPVLLKEDGAPLYTFASVVDDAEMGVTHVIRGEDHVTNTAPQIQIAEALGYAPPAFAHMAMMVGAGGLKLSKRTGSLSIEEMREAGLEPQAVLSLLARLGSADPVEPRLSLAEMAEGFDLGRFGRAPAHFDPAELDILNAKILHATPFEAAEPRLRALGLTEPRLWHALRPNLQRLEEVAPWLEILAGRRPEPEEMTGEDRAFAREAFAALPPLPWDSGTWKAWTEAVKAQTGRKGKALFMPLRLALTGRAHGPDMSELLPFFTAAPPAL
ncbi:glutamate--tRNA ligase [Neomegalonema perideroedes]|uniref:glutamate--tRNA ligase n=1 Tax=Neomegalonema perideroedes TaxID=217219 RepID=UPI000361272F|nr:glutamate--tRNA ligase [Neomegalonema perideroedes]